MQYKWYTMQLFTTCWPMLSKFLSSGHAPPSQLPPGFFVQHDVIWYGISWNHIIIECLGLEGTYRGHLVQPDPVMSRDIFNKIRLLRAQSNLTLNVSRDGTSTTSLGNLFQCFTTLIVKYFFQIFSLNLPFFSLKPLSLVPSQQALYKHWKSLMPLKHMVKSSKLLFLRRNYPPAQFVFFSPQGVQ